MSGSARSRSARSRPRAPRALLGLSAALVLAAPACGDGPPAARSPVTAAGETCPSEVLDIVVTIDPWTDVVERLAGACGEVTTIVSGTAVDPHHFEPTPSDAAAFEDADVVVMNGLAYDHWAEDALEAARNDPVVVDAGAAAGRQLGDDPHVWYGPRNVELVAAAVTNALQERLPAAAGYFRARDQAFRRELQPYWDEVAVLQAHAGARYAATEPVFDAMAHALGLVDVTPAGHRRAVASESETAPGDVHEFEQLLRSGDVDVLVYNRQTSGSLTDRIRGVAERAGVPVVEVTETMPAGATSFVDWQVRQLRALEEALR